MLCARLALLLALSPHGSMCRGGHQVLRIRASAIGCGHTVPGPHQVRCSPKGKVIGLQGETATRGLVEQNCEAQGAGLALADAAQKKVLRDAAVDYGIDQQNVTAFQTGRLFPGGRRGTAGEKDLAPRPASEFDIADVFADEVERDGNANMANEVGGKNKGSIHSYDNIQFSAVACAGDFAAQRLEAIRNARSRVSCYIRHRYATETSVITTPLRVDGFAAKSTATGKPRDQTTDPPEVRTGQATFCQRLTPASFKSRDNLWRFRWPSGCTESPGLQLRTTRGERNESRSRTAPVTIVSRPSTGQSITRNRRQHECSTSGTSASPV